MPKFSALIAVLLAFLVVPALASAAPTATQITSPANQAFVTLNGDSPGTLHVAGTTIGAGNVDLRCYAGNNAFLIANGVPVVGNAFSTDVSLTQALLKSFDKPRPFCMLRAVPAGTIPVAPPDLPSSWGGAVIGWGEYQYDRVGTGHDPTPADFPYDYFVSQAQANAFNDYYSVGSCGLCDTYLFVPGTLAPSNPIWWSDAALFPHPTNVTNRTGIQIDGASAYSSASTDWGMPNHSLLNNPGLPSLSFNHSVDPATGDVSIDEHSPFSVCAEDRLAFPPTDQSCATFEASGVELQRSIQQSNSGRQVTFVDHFKSVDGKPHDLDLLYEDIERSENAGIAGREGRLNFTWTPDGFKKYDPNTQIPVPPSLPASILVKTDASTGVNGDNMNPYGAMSLGSKPSEVTAVQPSDTNNYSGVWHTRYQRTIPAGGEVSIAVAYTHDFALASVQSLRQAAETAIAAPSIGIDSPADGSTVDAGSAHVTGIASSPDGQVGVKVNGADAPVGSDGHWSADVPLSEGANRILAVASNKLGVTSNAIVSVTRPAAVAAPAPAPAATTAAAAKAVRCVVPKLRGKTLPKAKRLLKHAHCRLGKVTRKASTKVKPGRVIKSRFKAGTRHRAGTRVRVTIAKAR